MTKRQKNKTKQKKIKAQSLSNYHYPPAPIIQKQFVSKVL